MLDTTLEVREELSSQSLTVWRRDLISELTRRHWKKPIPPLVFALAKSANPSEFRLGNMDAIINELLEEVDYFKKAGW